MLREQLSRALALLPPGRAAALEPELNALLGLLVRLRVYMRTRLAAAAETGRCVALVFVALRRLRRDLTNP